MAPLATLPHRAVFIAVGLAANRREADGSTPSTAASDPFTRTRAASTGSAARTPGTPRTVAAVPAGRGSLDTTSTSAGSSLRTGAAEDELPPAGSALGGRPGCGGASIAMARGGAPPGPEAAPPVAGEAAATTSSEPAAIRTGPPAPRSQRRDIRLPPGTRWPRTGAPDSSTAKTRILRTRIPRTPWIKDPPTPDQNTPGMPGRAWVPGHRMPRFTAISGQLPTPGCIPARRASLPRWRRSRVVQGGPELPGIGDRHPAGEIAAHIGARCVRHQTPARQQRNGIPGPRPGRPGAIAFAHHRAAALAHGRAIVCAHRRAGAFARGRAVAERDHRARRRGQQRRRVEDGRARVTGPSHHGDLRGPGH